MRWIEQGEGLPVVLVHGLPTSPALWRLVIPRLARVRVLAWEMVGYGDSIVAGRERDISLRRQVDYLHAWLAALGVDAAVLVGHDLGGGVAQIAAVQHPERCLGLVLVDSVGYDSWPIASLKALRAGGALFAHLPLELLQLSFAPLFYRGHSSRQFARLCLSVHAQPYRRHDGSRALIRQARSLDVGDTLAVQDSLLQLREMPARVVWGAADPFQAVRYGHRFARDLDCELVRIERGRHFVPEDQPDIVAAAIGDVVELARQRQMAASGG